MALCYLFLLAIAYADMTAVDRQVTRTYDGQYNNKIMQKVGGPWIGRAHKGQKVSGPARPNAPPPMLPYMFYFISIVVGLYIFKIYCRCPFVHNYKA